MYGLPCGAMEPEFVYVAIIKTKLPTDRASRIVSEVFRLERAAVAWRDAVMKENSMRRPPVYTHIHIERREVR